MDERSEGPCRFITKQAGPLPLNSSEPEGGGLTGLQRCTHCFCLSAMASKSRKLHVAGTAHASEDVGPIKGEEVKVFNLPSRRAATVDLEGA